MYLDYLESLWLVHDFASLWTHWQSPNAVLDQWSSLQHMSGRLIMAFDATYLSQTLCQMTLNGTHGLVGGSWTMEAPQNSLVSLEKSDLDVRGMPRASLMMHFLTWDPCAAQKAPLAACSVPLDSSFAEKPGDTGRGSYAMLHLFGQLMTYNDSSIAGVCFDSHGSHSWIRKYLHGQHQDLESGMAAQIPWVAELTWTELPSHDLPRLPIKIAWQGDKPIWGLCGPCASDFVVAREMGEFKFFSFLFVLRYVFDVLFFFRCLQMFVTTTCHSLHKNNLKHTKTVQHILKHTITYQKNPKDTKTI